MAPGENGPKDPSQYLLDQAIRHAAGHPEHREFLDESEGPSGIPPGYRVLKPEEVAAFMAKQAQEEQEQRRVMRRQFYRHFTLNVGVSWLVTFTATAAALYCFWHWLR